MEHAVELDIRSNFSFLEGASHAEELVAQAAHLGYGAIGIADTATMAGMVRAHEAARSHGVSLIVGSRMELASGDNTSISVLAFAADLTSYGRLCRILTEGRSREDFSADGDVDVDTDEHAVRLGRGAWSLSLHRFLELAQETTMQVIVTPPSGAGLMRHCLIEQLAGMRRRLGDALSLGVRRLCEGDDDLRLRQSHHLSRALTIPLVACGDVHYHIPSRRRLQDLLTAIRHRCTVAQAGRRLFQNAERVLVHPDQQRARWVDCPESIERAQFIATTCSPFALDQIRYVYPHEVVPPHTTAQEWLETLTWRGAHERYPNALPNHVRKQIEHEFSIIRDLNYATYFLTVHDIVREARSRRILCQGRGAAANSAVCYCLGVTAVDPARIDLLFERFVSRERDEPPDIDIDFEHERREEIIQYIYAKYGRERAALCAEVICYRERMAVRDVGKALGLPFDSIDALASAPDPHDTAVEDMTSLVRELIGFPRHLSQHVGGFVITEGPLCELVPVRESSMDGRTIVEWDKDDIDTLGMLKVDCLALGMLTAIRKTLALVSDRQEQGAAPLELHTIPAEDTATYDMICMADTVGVFQIESRAQMSMLPRLRPRCFYDLVIEVALVRPGPIQGDMVHPYLRRRRGEEPIVYPDDDVRRILQKTLGIPLFQEQAMLLSVVAAGFTPGEADQLRRAIAAWKRREGLIDTFGRRIVDGMTMRGYDRLFAEQVFQHIRGFSGYGFPESHAASFALLVYASAWLKRHHPAAFCAALLNSQPMGFYAPAQLVRDARDHGVDVRRVCILHSAWDCSLEEGSSVRLGMRMVRHMRERDAQRIIEVIQTMGPPQSMRALWQHARVPIAALRRLARADAFAGMGLDRQQSLWHIRALHDEEAPLEEVALADHPTLFDSAEPTAPLPAVRPIEKVAHDFDAVGLSLRAHPISFLRERLVERGVVCCADLRDDFLIPHQTRTAVAGIVLVRQRPQTAKGIVFMTIEDETGPANLILRPRIYESHRAAARHGGVIVAHGTVEKRDGVINLIVRTLFAIDSEVAQMVNRSRDFH